MAKKKPFGRHSHAASIQKKDAQEFLKYMGQEPKGEEEDLSFEELLEQDKGFESYPKDRTDSQIFQNALDSMTHRGSVDKSHPVDRPRTAIARPRKKRGVEAVLDLHGLRVVEAISQVKSFCEASKKKGCHRVLIIHGKGSGKLKVEVTDFLLRSSLVTTINPAPGNLGGQGAIIAYLR